MPAHTGLRHNYIYTILWRIWSSAAPSRYKPVYTYHRNKSSTVVFHISFKNRRVRFFNRNDFILVHSDAVPICTRLFVLKVTFLSFCTCITNNYYNDSNYIPFLQLQNHFGRGRPIEGCYLLHSDEVFHLHCTCITKLFSEYVTSTMVGIFYRGLRKFYNYTNNGFINAWILKWIEIYRTLCIVCFTHSLLLGRPRV